jgi:enoyl-CoA hydratase/carnithine racemase
MDGPRSLRIDRMGDDGSIVVLRLDRPAVRNAIDTALLGELLAAVGSVAAEPAVRGCVITGSEVAFSAGMDLKERAGFSDADLRAQRIGIVALMTAVHELPVPAVAAVEGPAIAGGFELALACDLVVAGTSAVFALPEVGVGIFPGGGATATLTWLVGPARARDILLTGRRLSAAEAEAWGIVARVVPDGRALDAAVALAASIGEAAPLGVREARAGIRAAHRSLADAMADEELRYEVVLRSEDRREGFRAFVERRRPRFRGR